MKLLEKKQNYLNARKGVEENLISILQLSMKQFAKKYFNQKEKYFNGIKKNLKNNNNYNNKNNKIELYIFIA